MSEEQYQPERQPVKIPNLCKTHTSLLVHQCGYKESDPWQALIVAAQVALFQAATCDNSVYERIGGDINRITEIGCLACCKPDAFGQIVEAWKKLGIGGIKALGEHLVEETKKDAGDKA